MHVLAKLKVVNTDNVNTINHFISHLFCKTMFLTLIFKFWTPDTIIELPVFRIDCIRKSYFFYSWFVFPMQDGEFANMKWVWTGCELDILWAIFMIEEWTRSWNLENLQTIAERKTFIDGEIILKSIINIIGAGNLGKTIGKLIFTNDVGFIQGICNTSTKSGSEAASFIGQGEVKTIIWLTSKQN